MACRLIYFLLKGQPKKILLIWHDMFSGGRTRKVHIEVELCFRVAPCLFPVAVIALAVKQERNLDQTPSHRMGT